MKDAEIIELYWQRKEQAIQESQNSYGRYCFSIALRILGNHEDCDECVNDTWMRAWNTIPPDRPDNLPVFLGTITRNLSLDKWKHKNAAKRGGGALEEALDELVNCIPAASTTEEIVEAAELQRLINTFLHTLPERDCNVFLRRYWYAEEYQEIARRYRMNLNSVKTSLFRTRGKLRSFLEQEGVVVS